MPDWMSYAYCEKCDRPLRESEYRSERTSSGDGSTTNNYCRLCGSHAGKPKGVFGFMIGDLFAWLLFVLGCGLLAFAYQHNQANGFETTALDMVLGISAVVGFPAIILAIGRFQKSTTKPIYDRWVHQHGTDPDKWPDASKPE